MTTYFIIQVPNPLEAGAWVQLGEWYLSREQAANALRGWRPELREVAQITTHQFDR